MLSRHLLIPWLPLLAIIGGAPAIATAASEPRTHSDATSSVEQSEVDHEDTAEPPWLVTAGGVFQANNIIGAGFVMVRYRDTYHRDPDSKLFNNLYRQVGGGVVSSIFTNQLNLFFEWLPITVLKLRLAYKGTFVTGLPSTFGPGLTFADPSAAFGDDVLSARKGENISTFAHQLSFEPTLQLKVWKVMLVNKFAVAYNYIHGSGGFLYDTLTDSLILRGKADYTFQDQVLLLGDIWQGDFVHKLYVGATYQFNYVHQAEIERHRVGGMILYSPARRISAFYEPTLIVMGGVNVVDRNREGQPYLLIMLRSGFEI